MLNTHLRHRGPSTLRMSLNSLEDRRRIICTLECSSIVKILQTKWQARQKKKLQLGHGSGLPTVCHTPPPGSILKISAWLYIIQNRLVLRQFIARQKKSPPENLSQSKFSHKSCQPAGSSSYFSILAQYPETRTVFSACLRCIGFALHYSETWLTDETLDLGEPLLESVVGTPAVIFLPVRNS